MKKTLIGLLASSLMLVGIFTINPGIAEAQTPTVQDIIGGPIIPTAADRGNTIRVDSSTGIGSFLDNIFGGNSRGGILNGGSGVGVSRPTPYNAQYDGPVFDGPGLVGGANQVEGRIDTNISRERNLKELIIGWTNFLLSIAAIMAVVALVWAGFLYITAFGDDSRMETAKKIVIWVILGILLILAAYAIVNTVMRAVF